MPPRPLAWAGWGGLLIPVGLLSLVLTGTAVALLLTPLGVL
ncbi:MAG: hypothetical protein ACKOPS_13125 [Cyanobium sp.]